MVARDETRLKLMVLMMMISAYLLTYPQYKRLPLGRLYKREMAGVCVCVCVYRTGLCVLVRWYTAYRYREIVQYHRATLHYGTMRTN